jgi:hypothetical protein
MKPMRSSSTGAPKFLRGNVVPRAAKRKTPPLDAVAARESQCRGIPEWSAPFVAGYCNHRLMLRRNQLARHWRVGT